MLGNVHARNGLYRFLKSMQLPFRHQLILLISKFDINQTRRPDKISSRLSSESFGPRTSHFPTMPATERQTKLLTYLYIHNCVRKKSNIFSARSQRRRQKGGKWANPNSSHVCLAGRQIGRSQRWQTMQISKSKPARCKWKRGEMGARGTTFCPPRHNVNRLWASSLPKSFVSER